MSLIYSIFITTLVKKVDYFLLGANCTDHFYVEFLDVREKKIQEFFRTIDIFLSSEGTEFLVIHCL